MAETVLEWVAPATCIVAAMMVAANAGTRLTGWGFVVFAVSSLAWIGFGLVRHEGSLVVQNAVLLAINLVGAWRWLGLRLRYERGAWAAVLRSRRQRQEAARLRR